MIQWLIENYIQLFLVIAALVAFLEAGTRLTKTESDDAFMERVGAYLRKVMDFLKIPNRRK